MREMALRSLLPEVQKAVREAEGRLPPELLAEAYFASGLREDLLALLERPIQISTPAERLLAWEGLLRTGGPRAKLRLGEALLQCGRKEGVSLLEGLLHEEPRVALTALGHLAYYLAEPMLGRDLPRARAYLERGLGLLDRVPGELAGRFLNDAARVPYEEGKPLEAMGLLEEALRRLPPESPYRAAPLTNLALLRLELQGDLLGRITTLEELGLSPSYTHANLPGHLRDLGRLYLLLGEREKAKAYLKRAQEAPGNPLAALEAAMLLAHLEGDEGALARLLAQAELWENPYLVARGRALLAELRGDPSLVEGLEGFLPRLTLALLKRDASLLPPYPEEREERLYWHAARYRLLGEGKDLDALLNLTQVGARILPVLLRHGEIPPLRAEVLGRFRLEGPLGPVALKGKAKEVFALLLLGLPREEVAFALWPDLSEEAALNNLYVWLARLRKALEPWGVPTYLLEEGLARVEADLFALERALAEGKAEEALRLYQEPLFPGLDHPLLDRRREEVFHRVRALFLQKGEPLYLERLLELDPLDEEALTLLVETCLKRGQRARALRFLEGYRKRLWQELGEKPSPRLQALLSRLSG
ncbi:transcriptional regulator [Thermus scotoductus]|nr:transcriptional regulator [Thermus scotoductus]